ncbi:MAG: Eco57I restriction-modification methylase domain-containing protein [Bacteroidales bacterium]|jgi:hypothetical protein|nr:Eco57I restriction-modification methylase domain-containing protein [Bacteroidales bacterium]
MDLKQPYSRQNWQTWLAALFGSQAQFDIQAENVEIDRDNIKSVQRFGVIKLADGKNLAVLDIEIRAGVQIARNRVGLRNLVEKFIDHARYHGILAFYHGDTSTGSVSGSGVENSRTESGSGVENSRAVSGSGVERSRNAEAYRMSFISSEPTINEDGSFSIEKTPPKRFTYVLGENEKTKTPADRLKMIAGKRGNITLDDIKNAFSVEALNKEFYRIVAQRFYQLVGATEGKGARAIAHERVLKLPVGAPDDSFTKKVYQEFAVRLIGRTVFCWFLKMKKSKTGESLLPEHLLSSRAVSENRNYYHSILEKLFFQTLNTPMNKRIQDLPQGCEQIPFLNGGLFEPQIEDYYLPSKTIGISSHINTLKIPDEWFYELFANLEQYNFTIDENSMMDVEVSVDPEMLGRIFENLLAEIDPDSGESARNATGSFYTPREIVDYMATESLTSYLFNQLQNKKETLTIEQEDLKILFRLDDGVGENSEIAKYRTDILNALDNLKILDPACGSGAFPMGILQKIVMVLQKLDPNAAWWKNKQIEKIDNTMLRKIVKQKLEQTTVEYARKIGIIQNSLYGVDIQPVAAEISKLRCFLTLIVDENIDDTKPNRGVEPLPNLEFKFVTANTLLQLPPEKDYGGLFNSNDTLDELHKIRLEYLQSYGEEKDELKERFLSLQKEIFKQQLGYTSGTDPDNRAYKISAWNPFSHEKTDWFDAEWMFGIVEGFDIVIGNPPYVSTKGVTEEDKKLFLIDYGFSDDIYNHFFFKAFGCEWKNKKNGINVLKGLLSNNGVLTYITPKTFWTTQTKRNLRDLLLTKTIDFIFDTANPFEAAMVDTCVTSTKNRKLESNTISFLDGSKSLNNPLQYSIDQNIYKNSQNSVIFKPTDENLKIYNLLGQKVKNLYNQWWDKIETSAKIAKNTDALEEYRRNLKPGDIALLGCLTEGGQGLATANNGKYIAVRKSTKWAKNILESRPKKLIEVIKSSKIQIPELENFNDVSDYLNSLSESQIADLFDSIKEKYGRDVFGQGYIFRLISDDELADVDLLTDDEKQNGIPETKNYYVPYDKGDKDGNRWYLETPFAIAWSQKNVGFLKTDPKARYQGYMFYFKEGFCWSDINTTFLKCRQKQKSINDVKSMSLYALSGEVPEYYIVSLINSFFMSYYVDDFVNNTQTFQINDARQLPIIIPTNEQLEYCKPLYDRAIALKQSVFNNRGNETDIETELSEIEANLNDFVEKLYYTI